MRLSQIEAEFSMKCPKCTTEQSSGLVKMNIIYTSEGAVKEQRCLNCGWRPTELCVTNINSRRKRKWIFKQPHELKSAA